MTNTIPETENKATAYPAIQAMADEIGEDIHETIERIEFIRYQKMVIVADMLTSPFVLQMSECDIIKKGAAILASIDEEEDPEAIHYEVYAAGADVVRVMFGWDVLDEMDRWEESVVERLAENGDE